MIDLLIIRANLFRIGDNLSKPKIKENMKELYKMEDGAFAVRNGIITDIGKTDEILKKYRHESKKIVDAANRAVLPGFVDSHTHAVFTGSRENEFKMRLEGKSYMDMLQAGEGILNSVKKIKESSADDLANELSKRVRLFFNWGTTTLEAKSGYGLDFENEIKMLEAIKNVNETTKAQIIPTFMGAHAIPFEYRNNKKAYIDIIVNKMIPYVAEKKLAEFIDVFCENGVYTADETKKILEAGIQYGLKAKIHSDEIKSIGCTELSKELTIFSCDHLLKITDTGLKSMKNSGAIATLLPGTAFSLKENYAPARKIIDYGVPVAIATDCNPGSSYTESMPAIITLSIMQMNMTPEEALTAATINAAYALGKASSIGSIDVGKQADFIILNESSYLFIAYHYGVNPIYATYKRGMRVASSTDN